MKFSIGDRVIAVSDLPFLSVGELGTVRAISLEAVGVEWDRPDPKRHDLSGYCPMYHGWWCCDDELDFAGEDVPEDETLTGLTELL